MANLRIFFAVVPPRIVLDMLSINMELIKKEIPSHYIKWCSLDKLHITLQFLSRVAIEELSALIAAVETKLKNEITFQLEFGKIEWFPNNKSPRILSLSIKSQTYLVILSNLIGDALRTLNYPVDPRPFSAHMSLGRIAQYDLQLEQMFKIKIDNIPPMIVDTVYLFESRHENQHRQYYPLASFKLMSVR